MKKSAMRLLTGAALVLCVAGHAMAAQDVAKQGVTKKQIVGWWDVVSSTVNEDNGTSYQPQGPHPRGFFFFDRQGHFIYELMNPDTPKFAAGNRTKGTPEEIRAAYIGNITVFGTYEIGRDGIVVFHVKGGSYPNWTDTNWTTPGRNDRRLVTVEGDMMKFTISGASTGGTAVMVLKRDK